MIKSDKWIKRQCEVNEFLCYITEDNILIDKITFNKDNYKEKLKKIRKEALDGLSAMDDFTMFLRNSPVM